MLEGDVEILEDLAAVVILVRADIVGIAQVVGQAGGDVVAVVARTGRGAVAHGAHQEDGRAELELLLLDLRRIVVGERIEAGIRLEELHRLGDGVGDGLVVVVHRRLDIEVGGRRDLLDDGLPCVYQMSVLALALVGLIIDLEHARAVEILEVAAHLVIAFVDVITAIIGRIHRMVADGVVDTSHRGILFVREVDGVMIVGMVKDARDDVEQLGAVRHHEDDRCVQAEDVQDALEHVPQDLPIGQLDLVIEVEALAHHADDGEQEREHDADQCHAAVNVRDRIVEEDDVDQIITVLAVRIEIDHARAGGHAEDRLHPVDDTAQRHLDAPEERIEYI